MTKNDRANFGSKLGVILASAGSAVGLGNIWRFPYETGNHGGAAFILIYLGCILLLGLPIMIAEFLIGRHSQPRRMDGAVPGRMRGPAEAHSDLRMGHASPRRAAGLQYLHPEHRGKRRGD